MVGRRQEEKGDEEEEEGEGGENLHQLLEKSEKFLAQDPGFNLQTLEAAQSVSLKEADGTEWIEVRSPMPRAFADLVHLAGFKNASLLNRRIYSEDLENISKQIEQEEEEMQMQEGKESNARDLLSSLFRQAQKKD